VKSVLVTGGAGYIGSHACKALHAAGYVPVTFDNLGSIRISYAHGPTGRIPTAAARTARGVGCLGSTAR